MFKMGLFGGDGDIKASFECALGGISAFLEAGGLSDSPSVRVFFKKLSPAYVLGLFVVASPLEEWNPNDSGGSEEGVVEASRERTTVHPVTVGLVEIILDAD